MKNDKCGFVLSLIHQSNFLTTKEKHLAALCVSGDWPSTFKDGRMIIAVYGSKNLYLNLKKPEFSFTLGNKKRKDHS